MNSNRLFFMTCLSLVLLAGCKKEAGEKSDGNKDTSLIGSWELHKTWGGMSPLTIHTEGNGNELWFDSTRYQYLKNGQVQHEGVYSLVRDSVMDVNSCAMLPPGGIGSNRIVYDNDRSRTSGFFKVENNTLTITSGCIPADGGVTVYRRKAGQW
jgi:hypothetical protein